MAITDPLILPDDVLVVPVEELPSGVRQRVEAEEGDYAVTRPLSRTPSKIVDKDAAALLQEFRKPKTIIEAVISYSQARKRDPEQMLTDAFPLIQHFMNLRLLVSPDAEQATPIAASFRPGDRVAGVEVLDCIQLLEDTELYQVKTERDELAALKIVRPEGGGGHMQSLFDRETAILRYLDGTVNPRLLGAGRFDERSYLVVEWCPGDGAAAAAEALRHEAGPEARRKLLKLCCSILDAYDCLHAQRVIHSDVHPRNVLVSDDGAVKIIDYGYARIDDPASELRRAQRGGLAFFFEPEYARAARHGHHPPRSSMSGEQYALGAMLYYLLTGAHYLDFKLEKAEMLRQIAEDGPVPFSERGVNSWPEVECLLARALSKTPSERFASVGEFRKMLARADTTVEEGRAPAIASEEAPVDNGPIQQLLDAVLERLSLDGPLLAAGLTKAPTCSMNIGAAGIAYALHRIASVRDEPSLLSLADVWATKAESEMESPLAFYNPESELTPEIIGQVTPYHTASGLHCARAFIAHAMGNVLVQQEAIEAFILASRAPCENLDLLLGRAGTVLAASLLLDRVSDSLWANHEGLLQLGDEMLQGVWERINSFAPVGRSGELPFSGIAHGWGGVLYATMRWSESARRPVPDAVAERLNQLAACAEPSGRGLRWKRMLRTHHHHRQSRDYWPGWCNGTAGLIHLWTLAHGIFGDESYLELAEKCAWHTWENPETLGDLCCGLGGRAYGLLNLYKHTGEREWLRRAQLLANRAAASVTKTALYPDSLYKGDVGIALLAADLERPEESSMPFFEHEGWPPPSAATPNR